MLVINHASLMTRIYFWGMDKLEGMEKHFMLSLVHAILYLSNLIVPADNYRDLTES